MNIKRIFGIILCLFIAGCTDDSSSSSTSPTVVSSIDSNGQVTYEESSSGVIYTSVSSDLDYKVLEITHNGSIDLTVSTSEAKDVYFILTNTDKSSINSTPTISSSAKSVDSSVSTDTTEKEDIKTYSENSTMEKIREFNSNPFKDIDEVKMNKSAINYATSSTSYSVGDSLSFYDADDNSVASTLRKKTTVGDTNLYVWVEDTSWTGNSGDVSQTMVDELSDKFLLSGSNNDIYDWVTNICGDQWGSHSYNDLIADNDDIHILLLDIDSDGTSGGVLGYYYSRDNFETSAGLEYSKSNEKIMFYIDTGFLSTADGSSWEITDDYPQEIISTLAHEFQHMINFYQKSVKNGLTTGAEDWLNEMLSMAVEDLVATKIKADGPRGVTYSDETAGSSNNTGGRLPLYNYYNDKTLTSWSGSVRNYAINYAFGAYLIRNFGGAEFVKALVQNDQVDYQAVTDALTELGYSSYDFDIVYNKFATANLLSEFTNAPDAMKFNSGTWFSSSEGDIVYSLGSINLYNYLYVLNSTTDLTGPLVYGETYSLGSRLSPVSNTYYLAGNNVYGSESFSLSDLDTDVKVTVVIK